MNLSIKIDVKESNPDDFYLQWPELFWWQMKFNLDLTVNEAIDYI